jgi:hypothetical protein
VEPRRVTEPHDAAGPPVEHVCDPPVPVTLTDDAGVPREGFVERWRGDRVLCSWSTGPGMRYLVWMAAERVTRL